MTEPCDHTSVGILVFQNGGLLLIDRKRPPFGLAAPAGHVDKHGPAGASEAIRYQVAATEELEEETGLKAISLDLVYDGRKENPCRRSGGTWHHWEIFRAAAIGELKPSTEETRCAFWCARGQMMDLLNDVPITVEGGRQALLEPVWKEFFNEIGIIKMF